jgi:hypothetical protein
MRKLYILALYLLAAGFLSGQPKPPAAVKIGNVVVQGSLRTRTEGWNWFGDAPGSNYVYQGALFRLGFGQTGKRLDWTLELAAPLLLGLPNDAVLAAPQGALGLGGNYFAANDRQRNTGMVFVKQGFLRFKGLFGDAAQSLRIGRFEFADGTETVPRNATLVAVKRDRIANRLLGTFGWTHVGRSQDGVQYVANRKKVNVTLVGSRPTRGVFQTDGWGDLNLELGYGAVSGQHNSKTQAGDWRLFGIYYQDRRQVVKTDNRPAAARANEFGAIRIGSFGGHYLHAAETAGGTVDLTFWGVAQTGRWGNLDHSGFAGLAEIGWQPKRGGRLKPWLRAGYYRGSGDADPNDGKHQTFFQVLPTPRAFARFPFYDMLNNQDISATLILRPHKNWTVRGEYRNLALAQAKDLWFLGGGAFQPWSFGYIGRPSSGKQGLAKLYDVSADWNINAHYALAAYAGYAAAGEVIEALYPKQKNGALAYLEFTCRF